MITPGIPIREKKIQIGSTSRSPLRLRRYIAPDDRALLPEIEAVIEATHYPYKIGGNQLDLLGKIIPDADVAQGLSPVWIQQIVIGLAQEWEMKPLEVLRKQASFLAALPFNTRWVRELFPQQLINAKIDEAARLLRLLETEPAIAVCRLSLAGRAVGCAVQRECR